MGNTQLFEYGIQTEKSDIRIHVCMIVRKLYVYKTEHGLKAINENDFRKVPVWTEGIRTAEGYLAPPKMIQGCQQVIVSEDIWQASRLPQYPKKGYQSEKGRAAVYIAKEALKQGLILLDLTIMEIDDKDMQIDGTDIYVKASIKIQVKCDRDGGPRAYGGTGNLFLQITECNPHSIY